MILRFKSFFFIFSEKATHLFYTCQTLTPTCYKHNNHILVNKRNDLYMNEKNNTRFISK